MGSSTYFCVRVISFREEFMKNVYDVNTGLGDGRTDVFLYLEVRLKTYLKNYIEVALQSVPKVYRCSHHPHLQQQYSSSRRRGCPNLFHSSYSPSMPACLIGLPQTRRKYPLSTAMSPVCFCLVFFVIVFRSFSDLSATCLVVTAG